MSFFMMLTVAPASSSRLWPGFCLAPDVMTIMSESAQTAGSSEPTIEPIGVNWMPWPMSSASASTLALLMS